MSWEATYLLSPILLLLLASGSWAQNLMLLREQEGKTVSVQCGYPPRYNLSVKTWCKKTSEDSCLPLVSSANTGAEKLRFFIQESSKFHLFTVIMTELKMSDSGIYHCAIFKEQYSSIITILSSVHLEVLKGSSDMSSPDIIPTTRLTELPDLTTTKCSPSDTTTTQPQPKSPAVVSSPDLGVTITNGTDTDSVSTYSFVVPVVCGLLSKTLVFSVLFVVTLRSFR